ncbi:hypothetical protein [Flavivirga jejuensis]|uniref:hypothetical protein n=1 Tax=Flavivirga jejuensis TaxID=870487 RepID=UPI0031E95F75
MQKTEANYMKIGKNNRLSDPKIGLSVYLKKYFIATINKINEMKASNTHILPE